MSFRRIIVAVSGAGRSLRNLIDKQPLFHYEVVGVISSSPNCRGNDVASEHKIPLKILNFRSEFRQLNIKSVQDCLQEWKAEAIVLAGFLKHWPTIAGLQGRVINIHPALLPKYGGPGMYGERVHNAVILNKELETGATVHQVDEIYDHGRIISQIRVPVLSDDTPDKLAQRVFAAECELLPRTIDKLAKSELGLVGQGIWTYDFDKT